jgi:hypothetical protein
MSDTVTVSLSWRHFDGRQACVQRIGVNEKGEALVELDAQPGLLQPVSQWRSGGWTDTGQPVEKTLVVVELYRVSSGGSRWWAWRLHGPQPGLSVPGFSARQVVYAKFDRLSMCRTKAMADAQAKADLSGWVISGDLKLRPKAAPRPRSLYATE